MRLLVVSVLGRSAPEGSVVVGSEEWPALWHSLIQHRIGSLLAPLVERGSLVLPPAAVAEVRDQARSSALSALQLSAAAAAAQTVLSEGGVEALVLKGLATGPLDYPAGWSRHTGDVDLLCRPADFDRGISLLREQGTTDRKSGDPVDLLVEETLVTSAGVELDIHHRLFRFGPPGEALLFENTVPLPDGMGGAMGAEGRLVHAAGHLLLSPPGTRRLSSLIDVALLSGRRDLDEDLVERMGVTFGIRDLVEFARWLSEAIGNPDRRRKPDRGISLINAAHIRTDRSVWMETAAILKDQANPLRQARYLKYQAKRTFRR